MTIYGGRIPFRSSPTSLTSYAGRSHVSSRAGDTDAHPLGEARQSLASDIGRAAAELSPRLGVVPASPRDGADDPWSRRRRARPAGAPAPVPRGGHPPVPRPEADETS